MYLHKLGAFGTKPSLVPRLEAGLAGTYTANTHSLVPRLEAGLAGTHTANTKSGNVRYRVVADWFGETERGNTLYQITDEMSIKM